MIYRLLHIVLIIFLATLQVVMAVWFDWSTPHLILAGVLALSLAGDLLDSWIWIGLGGLLLDLMNSSALGLSLILLSLVGFILMILTRRFLSRPATPIALILFLVSALLYFLIENGLDHQLAFHIWLPALLTALVAGLFYRAILWLSSRREVIHLG